MRQVGWRVRGLLSDLGAAVRPVLAGLGRRLRRARDWRRSPVVLYAVAAASGSLLLTLCGFALASAPVDPGSARTVVFEVAPGAPTVSIARGLEREGLIRDRLSFRVMAALLGFDGRLKAGRYELSPGYSTWHTLRKIGRGEVVTVAVTVPEGLTLAQIEGLLEEEGLVEPGELRRALEELDARGELPILPEDRGGFIDPYEGVLFPDTYFFEATADPVTIARAMARRTQEVFTPERVARATSLGMTPFEVLTLASIIEKEAVVDEERPLISSVYHNRLRAGMKLDACPTVFYVLGKPMSEPLLFADLEVDSPYNTYLNAGLPPGPICSPGLASIDAALYPAETSYYYFVSKNDGTHHFSRTLAEHNRAVAEYQGG